jgi:hypothetical protein
LLLITANVLNEDASRDHEHANDDSHEKEGEPGGRHVEYSALLWSKDGQHVLVLLRNRGELKHEASDEIEHERKGAQTGEETGESTPTGNAHEHVRNRLGKGR